MNADKINILPENEKSEEKQVKDKSGKKMAGKAAQFAGAAGVGAAATMAANAVNNPDGNEAAQVYEAVSEERESEQIVEIIPEESVEFDPNDIMIEEVEEIVNDEDEPELDSVSESEEITLEEPQPLTAENEEVIPEVIEITDIDNPLTDPLEDVIADIPDDSMIELDGYPELGSDEIMVDTTDDFMDNGDALGDPDILGDILNA